MKKRTRVVLLSIGGLLVVSVLGLIWLISPMFGMLPTGQVAPGLWAINDVSANSFVIAKGNTLIMVDAGISADDQAAGIKSLGLDPQSVTAVLLTHGDPDHAGGLAAFPKAIKYVAEEELPLLRGEAERFFFGIGMRGDDQSGGLTSLAGARSLEFGTGPDKIEVVVIPTPGHTPGSTTYLVDGKWLFIGDVLLLRAGKAELLWNGINNDSGLSETSLRSLVALGGVELLLTAHSGMSRDFAAAMAAW